MLFHSCYTAVMRLDHTAFSFQKKESTILKQFSYIFLVAATLIPSHSNQSIILAISIVLLMWHLRMQMLSTCCLSLPFFFLSVSCSIIIMWLNIFTFLTMITGIKLSLIYILVVIIFATIFNFQYKNSRDNGLIAKFYKGIIVSEDQIEIVLTHVVHCMKKKEVKTIELLEHFKSCEHLACECKSFIKPLSQSSKCSKPLQSSGSLDSCFNFAQIESAKPKGKNDQFRLVNSTLLLHPEITFVFYYISLIYIDIFKSVTKSMFNIMRIEQSRVGIYRRYIIFCLKKLIVQKAKRSQDTENIQKVNTAKLISMHEDLNLFLQMIRDACINLLQFWKEVSNKTPKADAIICEGDRAISCLQLIEKSYCEFTTHTTVIIKGVVFYLLFSYYVEEDYFRCADLLNHIDSYKNTLDNAKDFLDAEEAMYGVNSSIVFLNVSANYNSMGKIVLCNNEMMKLLGYSAKECIGNNIKMLMPNCISRLHDDFLFRFFEKQETRTKFTVNQFALHQHGFIVPVQILIRISPHLDDGMRISVFMKEIKFVRDLIDFNGSTGLDSSFVFMLSPNMRVLAFNRFVLENVFKDMNLNANNYINDVLKVAIKDIFPGLFTSPDALQSSNKEYVLDMRLLLIAFKDYCSDFSANNMNT